MGLNVTGMLHNINKNNYLLNKIRITNNKHIRFITAWLNLVCFYFLRGLQWPNISYNLFYQITFRTWNRDYDRFIVEAEEHNFRERVLMF